MEKEYIYIVDDDKNILESLGRFFKMKGYIVKTYLSAELYLEDFGVEPQKYGCLVSDIDMEGINGLEFQGIINKSQLLSLIPLVFITGHANVSIAIKAMKYGAEDFIEKPFSANKLLEVIKKVLLENQSKYDVMVRYLSLTKKELLVFNEVIVGKKNKNICEILFMSLGTVEAHRAKIMTKMKANSIAELASMSNLILKTKGKDYVVY